MAGRKSSRTSERVASQKEKKSAILSPHDELRERLLETALDVKENIPERRVGSRSGSVGSQQSDCSESRKRQSTERGPAAKRHSNEKHRSISREDSFSDLSEDREVGSASSGSASSRTRGHPLPVMLEEEEVFDGSSSDHLTESEESHEIVRFRGEIDHEEVVDGYDEDDVDDEERVEDDDVFKQEQVDDDDEFEDETEEEDDKPIQNASFADTKRIMNDPQLHPAPSLLSTAKCQGIGSPTKVWTLMVKRDDIPRATRFCLQNHPDMTVAMRRLLVEWMMEVSDSEKLHRETFHLAVDYVDRYLEASDSECSQDSFQLVGTAALFIAAKYEEIYPPKCQEFARLTDDAFTAENIRSMEVLILRDINYSLGPITSIQWLSTYLQLIGTGKKDDDGHYEEGNMYVPEFLRSEYIEMCKILDYLLFELDSFNFSYRTIAAAVLFVSYEPTAAVEEATGFERETLLRVIEYVQPVCRAFATQRGLAGDIIPDNHSVRADDAHNIQTPMCLKEFEPLVKRERDHDRAARARRRLV